MQKSVSHDDTNTVMILLKSPSTLPSATNTQPPSLDMLEEDHSSCTVLEALVSSCWWQFEKVMGFGKNPVGKHWYCAKSLCRLGTKFMGLYYPHNWIEHVYRFYFFNLKILQYTSAVYQYKFNKGILMSVLQMYRILYQA